MLATSSTKMMPDISFFHNSLPLQLSPYECQLAEEVLCPSEISTTFSDIGGMDEELQEVKDNVILPLKIWHKIKHSGTFID